MSAPEQSKGAILFLHLRTGHKSKKGCRSTFFEFLVHHGAECVHSSVIQALTRSPTTKYSATTPPSAPIPITISTSPVGNSPVVRYLHQDRAPRLNTWAQEPCRQHPEYPSPRRDSPLDNQLFTIALFRQPPGSADHCR